MKRKLTIAVVTIAVLAGVCCFLPCRRLRHWDYNCAICGAEYDKRISYFFSLPFCRSVTPPRDTELSKMYADFISEPHEHVWVGGGYATDIGTLLGYAMTGDGRHVVAGTFPHQDRLTRLAIQVAAYQEQASPEMRRQLYRFIRDSTNEAAYLDVMGTYCTGKGADPSSSVWVEWLENKKIPTSASTATNYPALRTD